MSPRVYGWKRDLPDHRDHLAVPRLSLAALPAHVDLRPVFPVACYDQGQLGSCTANALAALVQFERLLDSAPPDFTPSRLAIYWGERSMEHTVNEDAGAMIRDGIKVLARTGAAPEAIWPYAVERFRERPPAEVFAEAAHHRVRAYQRVRADVNGMRAALASGSPVAFGFSVFESFETEAVARTGQVPMPGRGESVLGGHAVAAFGYDDASRLLLVRNSWGATWGQGGYFYLPYDFITAGLCDDFWQVQVVP